MPGRAQARNSDHTQCGRQSAFTRITEDLPILHRIQCSTTPRSHPRAEAAGPDPGRPSRTLNCADDRRDGDERYFSLTTSTTATPESASRSRLTSTHARRPPPTAPGREHLRFTRPFVEHTSQQRTGHDADLEGRHIQP